ncbi:PP_RS20740 family protein [Streptomyces canus]|uniref:PP_RS20740 family protein n=1 Tax=Streptomyces canus TaxID=58343 RepID=UPI0027843D22|nr:hypothetical protein [Streptomyces canus]MDQ1068802.1 hypothetical protein [Streptomyces canus]
MAEEVTDIDEPDDLRALLGDGPVPFPTETKREFKPWHRPRKQYVRRAQWSREIGFLARDLNLSQGELRYLTLPGNDLLDIRHIADTVCLRHEVTLRYLGFDTAAMPQSADQTGLNIAQFSVKGMNFIHPESEVFPGDFREVGISNSVPWRRIRREGPFHAINIDLCGGFAGREKSSGIPNYFKALQAILQNQASSDEEFLLFITTRMDDDSVAEDKKETLIQLAQEIHDACQEYASEFAKAWGVQESSSPVQVSEHFGAGEAFMLGLTQWIISHGVDVGLKASVKSFMTYRTGSEPGEDDIVSLAIRFKPDPFIPADRYGLAEPSMIPESHAGKLCKQSAAAPKRVRDRVHVDEILRTSAEEFQKCIEESSKLLGAAGYDPDRYSEWATQESG